MRRRKDTSKAWEVLLESKYSRDREERIQNLFELLAPQVVQKTTQANEKKVRGNNERVHRALRACIQ